MNIRKWSARSAIAISLALSAQSAYSAQAAVNPDKLPKVSCSSFTFSLDFLNKYPKAPAACQEGRVYKGKKYAKFNGKVSDTETDSLTVQLLNVSGDVLSTLTFKPSAKAKVMVNGKAETYSDLRVGDTLTFWVPENRFSIYSAPGATSSASPVLPPH
jgi:hypothetical protein